MGTQHDQEASSDGDKPGRTTNLGIEPVQWRRPATVVPGRPSTLVIVVVLTGAGLLSLVLALLALH
jgi:hypothetical protein